MLARRDGIQPDLKFKNRIGEVIPDMGDDDSNVDLIAGVNVDDAEINQDEYDNPYQEANDNEDPLFYEDPDDLVAIANDNDATIPGVDPNIPGVDEELPVEIDPVENNQDQPQAPLRRSTRARKPVTRLTPNTMGIHMMKLTT